jgi:hypothetical protein
MVEQPVGSGILYVLSDVEPRYEGAFTQWCNDVHHFETMEVEGFLSLRRFERIFSDTDFAFRLLTLYQLEDPSAAAGDSYHKHSETYTPIPEGVLDGLSFGRAILEAVSPVLPGTSGTVARDRQTVGSDVLSVLVGPTHGEAASRWLADSVAPPVCARPGVLSARVFAAVDDNEIVRYLLQVELESKADLEQLVGIVHASEPPNGVGGVACVAYRQVFPTEGTLLRDRRIASFVDSDVPTAAGN